MQTKAADLDAFQLQHTRKTLECQDLDAALIKSQAANEALLKEKADLEATVCIMHRDAEGLTAEAAAKGVQIGGLSQDLQAVQQQLQAQQEHSSDLADQLQTAGEAFQVADDHSMHWQGDVVLHVIATAVNLKKIVQHRARQQAHSLSIGAWSLGVSIVKSLLMLIRHFSCHVTCASLCSLRMHGQLRSSKARLHAGRTTQEQTQALADKDSTISTLTLDSNILQQQLNEKDAESQAKAAHIDALSNDLDELQSAVAQLEMGFAAHRQESDSQTADLQSRLQASHVQVPKRNYVISHVMWCFRACACVGLLASRLGCGIVCNFARRILGVGECLSDS